MIFRCKKCKKWFRGKGPLCPSCIEEGWEEEGQDYRSEDMEEEMYDEEYDEYDEEEPADEDYDEPGWLSERIGHLPSASEVLWSEDGEYTIDLTKVKGMSMTEICYLFYKNYKSALPALRNLEREKEDCYRRQFQHYLNAMYGGDEKKENKEEELAYLPEYGHRRLFGLLFAETALERIDIGPLMEPFFNHMKAMEVHVRTALRSIYDGPAVREDLKILEEACEAVTQNGRRYVKDILFCGLVCPLLGRGKEEEEVIAEIMEPHMREILREIEQAYKNAKIQLDIKERRRFINEFQSLCMEYVNLYAVRDYEWAEKYEDDFELYRKYLEDAAAYGLSLACAKAAGKWLYGEEGFPVHMGYAKYYVAVLKLRGLNYPVTRDDNIFLGVDLKAPGMDDEAFQG